MTTITDAVQAKLKSLYFKGIQQVVTFGKDECGFSLHFDRHVDADLMGELQTVGCVIQEVGEQAVAVLVPASWLPTAESDVEVKATSEPIDPIVAKVRAELERLGYKAGAAKIARDYRGKDCEGNCYSVTFITYEDMNGGKLRGGAFTSHFVSGRQMVLGIPDAWREAVTEEVPVADPDLAGFMRPCEFCNGTGTLTSSVGMTTFCPQCDGTGIHEADDEAPAIDPALDETARTINTLRDQVKQLTAANEKLESRVEDLVEQRDELIEQRDSAFNMAGVAADLQAEASERAMEGRALMTTPCKEVKTQRDISDSDLQKAINEGWDIRHIQFEGTALNVVFIRESVTSTSPAPLNATRKLVQPVGQSMVIYPPMQPQEQFEIPQYDVPLNLTRDERVKHRVEQIQDAARAYAANRVFGGQQS